MESIKADYERRISIEGVPNPVLRPVDVDQAKTGFQNLRTLRIYRFDPESVIDGHAEKDEVFIVLLSGSAELSLMTEQGKLGPSELSADGQTARCGAYLPPNGAYKLVARTLCDVAYVRATPVSSRPAKFLARTPRLEADGTSVVLEEFGHAEKLRIRLLQIEKRAAGFEVLPIHDDEGAFESLIHVRTIEPERPITAVGPNAVRKDSEAGDTLAISPGEYIALRIPAETFVQALVVFSAN